MQQILKYSSTRYQAFTRLWRQGGKHHQHSTEELMVTSSKGMETKAMIKASPPGQRLFPGCILGDVQSSGHSL